MTRTSYFRHLTATLTLIVITSFVFWFKPSIDIISSNYFYTNGSFWLHSHHAFTHMPQRINLLLIITGIVLISGLIVSTLKPSLREYRRPFCFLLMCFLLGPGLLVNGLLKTYSGRPRPQNITAFQGSHPYQKVWVASNACDHNCSFVCGDCAATFCFIALVFVTRRKKLTATIVILAAGFFSFLRLGLGKHFISDIMLAWQLDYLVILVVYYAFYLRGANHQYLKI